MRSGRSYKISLLMIGLSLFLAARFSVVDEREVPDVADEAEVVSEVPFFWDLGTPEPEEYSVDGVRLGMTEDEVCEVWGEVRRSEHGSKRSVWLRPVNNDDRPFSKFCCLDSSGRVLAVGGSELSLRQRELITDETPLSRVENLGRQAATNREYCMSSGIRFHTRAVGDVVIECTGEDLEMLQYDWESYFGRKLKGDELNEFREKFGGVRRVELTRLEHYRNPPWKK